MEIYLMIPDSDTYDSLFLYRSDDWEIFHQFIGKALARLWTPIKVQVLKAEKSGDFPSLSSHVPVFTEHALRVLESIMGRSIEALPLECNTTQLYAINVLELIALDLPNSEVKRLPSGGIMDIKQYAFGENDIRGKHIFKIREAPLHRVLVSDDFKLEVERNGLEGLIFRKAF